MAEIFLHVFPKRCVQIFHTRAARYLFASLLLVDFVDFFFFSNLSRCCVKMCEKCNLYIPHSTSSRIHARVFRFSSFPPFSSTPFHLLARTYLCKTPISKPFWCMRQYVIGSYRIQFFFLVFYSPAFFFLAVLHSRLCLQKKMLNSTWPN